MKALVQAWVSGAKPNHGFVLATAGKAHTLIVASEHNQASQRPALSVTYTVPDDHCAPNPCEHGGTCTNQVQGFTCACAAGFEGDRCETEIDDCAGAPCVHGACTDVGLAYTCACDAGYAGSNCDVDIDECAAAPCQNGGTCTQGVGSYTCACLPGYAGASCEEDIDECAGSPCQNGAACHDGVGGYTCTCVDGFEGANCEINQDDCAVNPCLHGTCEDGVDTFTCTCAPGYDGATCDHDIVDCAVDACANGGTCLEGVDGYTCACLAGYSGARCEIDDDDCAGDPCVHGLCVDGAHTFTCECDPGYEGPACDVAVAAETALSASVAPTATVGTPTHVDLQLARLTSPAGPLGGAVVSVTVGGPLGSSTWPLVTDATGAAHLEIDPVAAGAYTIAAAFAGDALHAPATASAGFVAGCRHGYTGAFCEILPPTTVTLSTPPAVAGASATIAAQLLDVDGLPLAGAPLTFSTAPSLGDRTVTTDGNGVAVVELIVAAARTYAVTARYGGDATHAASSASVNWVVASASAALSLDELPNGTPGIPFPMSAQLVRTSAPAGPIAFATVTFTITAPSGESTVTVASTGIDGLVTIGYRPLEYGPHLVSVSFAGDAATQAVTISATLQVPAPADATPPTIVISAPPAEGATTSATSASFVLSTDEPAVICWRLDLGAPTCTAPGSTVTSASVSSLLFGDHELAVTATDAAGNQATAARHWTVTF